MRKNNTSRMILMDAANKIPFPSDIIPMNKMVSDQSSDGPEARANSVSYGQAYVLGYDGEKDRGTMGTPIEYIPEFERLSIRSWQSYLESDVSQTIIKRYVLWVVGKGLKFQYNPIKPLTEFNESFEKSTRKVEYMFELWAGSKNSSHNKETSLNWLGNEAYKSGKIGGDVLVILRWKNNNLSVQNIDGSNVGNPMIKPTITNGHILENGIETNKSGEVVAYYVRTEQLKYKRIKAVDPTTGLRVAFMYYGSKFRIDSDRGLPVIATTLQSLKQLDRYKEATVGSAEERQKIAYFIEHHLDGDGTSPHAQALLASFNVGADSTAQNATTQNGVEIDQVVTASTQKQTFNLSPGSKMSQLDSKNEIHFSEFHGSVANIICACVGIPPNVAFSLYTDSFSASRAATKDWEHTLNVERDDFSFQYYKPIFEFWLHMNVLTNQLSLPGYIDAYLTQNLYKLSAFRNCRFMGAQFPHIDPLKEVKAERAKLGPKANDIPLTTVERSTEALNSGDALQNIEKFADELEIAEKAGIITPEPEPGDGE
jgi:capsid protein